LNFFFGVLAVLGLILAAFRLRQIRFSILIIWILVTVIFAGALLENPPNSHRFIIAMPAVCLLAAVALNELFGALSGQAINQSEPGLSSSGKKPLIHSIILLAIAIAITLFDVGFYFGTYRQEHQFGDRNTEIADGVAEYLNSLDGQWVAHFYGPPLMYVDFPTIPFLARDFTEGFNLFNVPEAGSPINGYESTNQSFIFLPERYGEIERLRSTYPLGREKSFSGYYADQLFYVFEVSGNT
jgi:hypothetical protein